MQDRPRNTKKDHSRARQLRNDASPFERKLWDGLRSMGAMRNLRFRRQQPIHPFIADFACMRARLLIELDGFSHETRQDYDERRDADLRNRGFHILRFTNDDISGNVENVVYVICEKAECLIKELGSPSATPTLTLPTRGRESDGSCVESVSQSGK